MLITGIWDWKFQQDTDLKNADKEVKKLLLEKGNIQSRPEFHPKKIEKKNKKLKTRVMVRNSFNWKEFETQRRKGFQMPKDTFKKGCPTSKEPFECCNSALPMIVNIMNEGFWLWHF